MQGRAAPRKVGVLHPEAAGTDVGRQTSWPSMIVAGTSVMERSRRSRKALVVSLCD